MIKRVTIIIVLLTQYCIGFSQTPVYFNIVSHNEISDPLNYRDSATDFNTIKPLVKELCDTIISKQAKYNMQVDGNFINGVLTWDNGASSSNDILQWANNSAYIDVDGHNHFNPLPDYADIPNHTSLNNPYKYSDLAKLLDSCGVTLAHNILGGVTYADTTVGSVVMNENWTQYATPTPGYTYTNFIWQADIVWGTASPNHVADYTRFGVWKPQGGSSPTQFGTHDPNATITHVGGGCKEDIGYNINPQTGALFRTTDEVISKILSIVDDIQNIPPTSNDFYTMNMLINFRDIPNIPNFADSIAKIIDGIQLYVNQGKIVWATLGEKYDLWYASHTNPNDYFNVDCADIPGLATGIEDVEKNDDFIIYPNPTTGIFQISGNISTNAKISVFNLFGEKVYANNFDNGYFNLSHLSNGIYLIVVEDNDGIIYNHKLIKN